MVNKEIWAQDAADKIKKKLKVVTERNQDNIPYTTENGCYDDWTEKNICWWTNGFWGGILWQLYYATKEELYKDTAVRLEEKLDRNLMMHQGMDHDSGFKWLTTSGAHYRITGNKESFNRLVLAADNLAGRFNIAGNFIRAWNDDRDGSKAGWAIIDCMMNLPLLYWAEKVTKDPRYLHIAKAHADMVIKNFVREDGSVKHIVEFNPETGTYVTSHGGQGYRHGSTWTRGQAWAIYGFVLSYLHTKEERYLEYAKKTADYFISHMPEGKGIPVDFQQPESCEWEDSTAAAIASCGMLEISKCTGDAKYEKAALTLLEFLAQERCNWSFDCDNIVERCTAAYHDKEHEFSIIYGDYFFIEAIWKITGQELFIW